MGDHSALGAAGGAGGVEDGGQVVGVAVRDLVQRRQALGQVGQAAAARRIHGVKLRHAGGLGDGAQAIQRLGPHQEGPWLGVAEEVGDLVCLVGGVERQVDGANLQAAEIEEDGVGRFLDLHGHPIALGHPEVPQGGGIASGRLDQARVARLRFLGADEEGPFEVAGEAALEDGKGVLGHRFG